MLFGGQVVTFVSVAEDVTHLDEYGKPAVVHTNTAVPGCLFRSVTPTYRDEKVDALGDITINQWRCTAPPLPVVMNSKANDEVIVAGVTYQIQVGARTFFTLQGVPYKCTIIVQARSG